MKYPWYAYVILITPGRVFENLERCLHAYPVSKKITPWQLCLAVLRMWHRLIFNPGTIGLSSQDPVRNSWRAKLFQWRPARFPFLLAYGSIKPLDYTGLRQTGENLIRHVVGTHHEGKQSVYDLQVLQAYGVIDDLYVQTQAIVEGTDKRHEWFKDLCVYESYHEKLLLRLEAWKEGDDQLSVEERANPDLTLTGALQWCSEQPPTPSLTFRAWRAGQFKIEMNA